MQVRIAMKYFTKKSLDFLKELEQNNDREWFHANKSRFQNDLEVPFRDLIENLIDEFQAIDPKIVITAKEAIFRIYRDVRFSSDKSPYKTHMSAIISAGGRKNLIVPGFYVELQKDKMMLYAGIYNPDTKTLEKIRYYIAEHGIEFKKLIADKDFVKVFGEIQGEKSKIIPKQFKEEFGSVKTVESHKVKLSDNAYKKLQALDQCCKLFQCENWLKARLKDENKHKDINDFIRDKLNNK